VIAGDLRKQTFADIWEHAEVFRQLREPDNLKGKCGCCEFRNVCMGCRARAFAATGDFLDEEPVLCLPAQDGGIESRQNITENLSCR
jgi:radical SAM protein with 4Fe4S-binding SPASM domain